MYTNQQISLPCQKAANIINEYMLQLVMLDPNVTEYDLSKTFYKYFTNPSHIKRFQELRALFSNTVGQIAYLDIVKPIFTFVNADGKIKIDQLFAEYC